MSKNTPPIALNILKCMRPEDRATMGSHNQLPEETASKNAYKLEKELQEQCAAHLRRHEIPFFRQRMDRKTTGTVGWPDFTIPVNGRTLYMECKTWDGSLSAEQQTLSSAFLRHGHTIFVVRSYDQFLVLLRDFQTKAVPL